MLPVIGPGSCACAAANRAACMATPTSENLAHVGLQGFLSSAIRHSGHLVRLGETSLGREQASASMRRCDKRDRPGGSPFRAGLRLLARAVPNAIRSRKGARGKPRTPKREPHTPSTALADGSVPSARGGVNGRRHIGSCPRPMRRGPLLNSYRGPVLCRLRLNPPHDLARQGYQVAQAGRHRPSRAAGLRTRS